jgi:glycosyltransferase involved in cell wall biosynthesis
MKISIITPIYNVANYIERCAESLLNQTLDEIEYIFVDDCTPDNSIEILNKVIDKYPNRKPYVHIVHNEKNLKLYLARQAGLRIAKGEYIINCDADDWVELDMCEKMYNMAKEKVADIVWCDFYMNYANREVYTKQEEKADNVSVICSTLSTKMWWSVWNKMIRRTLYLDNNVSMVNCENYGEDMITIKLFYYANKIAYLPRAYYHYDRSTPYSITKEFSSRRIDLCISAINDISCFFESKKDYPLFENAINELKISLKTRFIYGTTKKETVLRLCNIFQETCNYRFSEINWQLRYINYLAKRKCIYTIIIHNEAIFALKKIRHYMRSLFKAKL